MKKGLIGLCVVTTILAGLFAGLWIVERNDSNKLAEENAKFREVAGYTRTLAEQIPVLFRSVGFVEENAKGAATRLCGDLQTSSPAKYSAYETEGVCAPFSGYFDLQELNFQEAGPAASQAAVKINELYVELGEQPVVDLANQ